MVEIKDRLYEMMERFDISQADITKRTGIPKSSLSMYLSGDRIPKADKIYIISKSYGLNEAWLMGYEGIDMIKKSPVEQANEDVELLQKWYKLSESNRSVVMSMIDSLLDKNI